MQAATGRSPQGFKTADFTFTRVLPTALAALEAISANFYWSWQPEGVALFRDLDPELWDKCEQNPRVFLKQISDLRLWQRAADTDYVERVNAFARRFNEYLA